MADLSIAGIIYASMLILLGGVVVILADRIFNTKKAIIRNTEAQVKHYLEAITRVTGAHVRILDVSTGELYAVTPYVNPNLEFKSISEQVQAFERMGILNYVDAMHSQGTEVEYTWPDTVGRQKHYRDVFYNDILSTDMYCLTLDVTEEVDKRARLEDTIANAAALARQLQSRNIEVNQLLDSVERLSAEKDEINSVGREDVQFLLSSIASAVDYTCTTGIQDPEITRTIKTQLEDITYTIDDMNWIATNRVTQAPIQTRNVTVPVMLRSLYKQHNANAKNAGIKFIFDIDQDAVKTLRLDFLRVRTMLDHLVRNAIEHSRATTITVDFSTYNHNGELYAMFVVQDDGIGITPKIQDEMYERFKVSGRSKHANIGLWECKELAKTAHGEIKFDERYTNGAKFIVSVPVQPASIVGHDDLELPDLTDVGVLIVTQSETINKILEAKFLYMGAIVETHTKVSVAVTSNFKPKYIITDYVLNTDSLKDAVTRLEGNFPDASVIILENDFEAVLMKRPMLPQPYTFAGIALALDSAKRYSTLRRVV